MDYFRLLRGFYNANASENEKLLLYYKTFSFIVEDWYYNGSFLFTLISGFVMIEEMKVYRMEKLIFHVDVNSAFLWEVVLVSD